MIEDSNEFLGNKMSLDYVYRWTGDYPELFCRMMSKERVCLFEELEGEGGKWLNVEMATSPLG